MAAKKSSTGFLTGLRRLEGSKKAKKTSWPKRILLGALVGVFLVVVGGFVILSALTVLYPTVGSSERETVCVLDSLDEHPKGYAAGVVAVGKTKIESKDVDLPFTEANRAGVAKGSKVRVRYTYFPVNSRVEVHEVAAAP